MRDRKVCVVIPAHNEEKTIANVVTELKRNFKDIIVVNDGSDDNTESEALRSGAIVVSNGKKMGYDRAIDAGFSRAKKENMDYVITVDADGQHVTEDVEKVASVLVGEGKDIVVGIRPKFARFAEYLMAFYSKIRYGIRDPLSGLKGYKMSVYEELGHFDSYNSIGTELAFYSVKMGHQLAQVPTSVNMRMHSSPSFGNSLSANAKILRTLFISLFRSF